MGGIDSELKGRERRATQKRNFPPPTKTKAVISSESEIPTQAFGRTPDSLKTEGMDFYARSQERRFANLMNWIARFLPRRSHVMDMGSHFLDQAVLLSEAGYTVHGFDAPAFTELPNVMAIAERHHIALSTIDDLSLGQFGSDIPDSTFDALIFAEVIEHLAFNPLLMWKSIFRVLKPNALLVVTTPNGLAIRRRIKEIGKIVLGIGKGLSLKDIFGNVTYGHHWK